MNDSQIALYTGLALGFFLQFVVERVKERIGRRNTGLEAPPPPESIPRPPPAGKAIAGRLGVFRLSDATMRGIYENGEGLNILDRMVIVDAQRDPYGLDWQLRGLHPDFDVREFGAVMPEYRAMFTEGSAAPRWVRVDAPDTLAKIQ